MIYTLDEKYMLEALKEAKKAEEKDEAPVGAVIVLNGKIIARGHNLRETKLDPTMHAEIVAIRKACKNLQSWRLVGATMYVTIEPCSMCAGTLLWTRINRIVYGAKDPKGGALTSSMKLFDSPNINHHPTIEGGILEEKCSEIIKSFFKKKREK